MILRKNKKEKVALQAKLKSVEERLTIASNLPEKISAGEFNVTLPPLVQLKKEEDKFYSTLCNVSDRLTRYGREEGERKWVAEGMSQFMTVLGNASKDSVDLYNVLLKLLIEYTGANQGGIFLLNEDQPDDPFLELAACYAFGKKKHEEKRVEIGQGMLGQCFLERETVFCSEIPQYYTRITSGLGEATPSYLLLIPMKYHSTVIGVIEFAYFKRPEKYKIDFAERIAENIASVTHNLRNAARAQDLYKESQEKAKVLQEQEEILRQNVEELIATQEEMKRNELELDRQTRFLKFIVDNIPFPIFVKDERGRYTIVNVAESKLFDLPDHALIGKDDSYFVKNKEEWDVIRSSDEQVLESKEAVELPLQYFTTTTGKSYVFRTTKIPFVNQVTGKKNILGVSIDLTEKIQLEQNLFPERRVNEHNLIIDILGRQRMLSQKIAFYCETLVCGKLRYANTLRDAIELHEHTMQIIRYGGMPMGIAASRPLPKLDEQLIPHLENIVQVWQTYKQAAENILYFASVHPNASHARKETERNITVIEDNAELLLTLNNDFMNSHLQYFQVKGAEV